MPHTKNWFGGLVLLSLLLVGLACSLPVLGGEAPTAAVTPVQVSAGAPAATQANPAAPAKTSAPQLTATPPPTAKAPTATPPPPTAKAPNAVPLPLRQGVSSLNSYRLRLRSLSTGPDKADRSEISLLVEVNTKTKSNHTHTETITSSADDPTPDTSSSDSYTVGGQSCQVSGSAKTPTGKLEAVDPLTNDLTTALTWLLDYNVYVENPVFVGEESVNGVATNHFTFKVTQLGKESGAVVNKNSGEYWVAKDGQYLVKYAAVLELANDKAGAKLVHAEMSVNLTDINQAVEIVIPAYCKK